MQLKHRKTKKDVPLRFNDQKRCPRHSQKNSTPGTGAPNSAPLHLCDLQDKLYLPPLPPPPAVSHDLRIFCSTHTTISYSSSKVIRGPERVI